MVSRIGVIGMSEDSNQFYTDMFPNMVGKKELEINLIETNFKQINSLLPGPSKELKKLLRTYLQKVSRTKYVFVPNITIHETLDEIMNRYTYKFEIVHPLKSLVLELKSKNISEVILFASIHTMKEGYVSNFLNENSIKCTFPNKKDIKAIDNIRKAVYENEIIQKNLEDFNKIIDKYEIMTPIVLACTELSIINNNHYNNVFDAASLSIQKFISENMK